MSETLDAAPDRSSSVERSPAERTGGADSRRWDLALVTGASSGIGEAIARSLAAEGTDLVVVARDRARLDGLAEELRREHGVTVEVLDADLSAPVSRAAVEKRLVSADRPVDLLVNNAGFGTTGAFATLPIGREEQEVQVNVLAVMRLTSAALGPMLERGRGTVVNVSSMAGLYPTPNTATYGATKAFVSSFSAALHEELAGSGVTVTAVLPGFTRTEFQDRANWTEQASVPEAAWLSAEDVAAEALDAAAAGRPRVVPGSRYRVVAAVTAPLSPAARRRVVRFARRIAR
ncbi:MAG: SDR family NAD(P)-dependent oxidoreductase [Microthrixaceae bacterium]